jgi:transposase InsO family protein
MADPAPISITTGRATRLSHSASRAEAVANLLDYIEVFYNRSRRHSALGYVSPAQFLQD